MTFPNKILFPWPTNVTILYNRNSIMLVYEGKIKLRLFSHALSYRLLHLTSVQLLAQFELGLVFLPLSDALCGLIECTHICH